MNEDKSEILIQGIVQDATEALRSDLLSYGWLRQIAHNRNVLEGDLEAVVNDAMLQLLNLGIKIGQAFEIDNNGEKYVKFVAWKGDVDQCLERALLLEVGATYVDRGFTFWFCLPENVDEYEAPKE